MEGGGWRVEVEGGGSSKLPYLSGFLIELLSVRIYNQNKVCEPQLIGTFPHSTHQGSRRSSLHGCQQLVADRASCGDGGAPVLVRLSWGEEWGRGRCSCTGEAVFDWGGEPLEEREMSLHW